MDIAIDQLVKKIEEETQGRLPIPEIHQKFSTGSGIFKIKGDFDAGDGRFE